MELKEEYLKKWQDRLAELTTEMDDLERRMVHEDGTILNLHTKDLKELGERKAAVIEKLQEIQACENEAWLEMKVGFEEASEAFAQTIKALFSKLF